MTSEKIVTDSLGFHLEVTINVGDHPTLGRHKTYENAETGKVDACAPHEIDIQQGQAGPTLVMVVAHEAYHLFKSVAHLITCEEEQEAETFGQLVRRVVELASHTT